MPLEVISEADKAQIEKALADNEALEIEIDKATRAGIDVSVQAAKLRGLKAQWLRLKEVYIEGR